MTNTICEKNSQINNQVSPKVSARITIKKFGGTSVGSIERIEKVADLVAKAYLQGQRPVVVASAMSGETNRLISLGGQIDPLYRGNAYDMLVASGEQVAISLLSIALQKRQIPCKPLLAYQLGIYTNSLFSKARITRVNGAALARLARERVVPIVAGFQGIDPEDQITTLGRGGSDTTAVALAVALKQEGEDCECEIYTDVPAIFTADPRVVKKAREIRTLSFEEMMEMASVGSKVLAIRCVELAAKYEIPVHLRSTFEDREGTWVVREGGIVEEQALVSTVTHEPSTVVFKLFPVPAGPRFLSDLFTGLANKGVVVDIITQSQNEEGQRIAFSVSEEDAVLTESFTNSFLPKSIKVVRMIGMSKISVIGVGMRNNPGVAARFFKVLADKNITVHIVTTSEIKISAVIDSDFLREAAEFLHTEFGLDRAE